jgi:hypothetical protein
MNENQLEESSILGVPVIETSCPFFVGGAGSSFLFPPFHNTITGDAVGEIFFDISSLSFKKALEKRLKNCRHSN